MIKHINITFFIFLFILFITLSFRCNTLPKKSNHELLRLYSDKTTLCHGKSYDVTIKRKDLFSEDTSIQKASVKYFFGEEGLEFLEIVQPFNKSGLYFSNDSLWAIDFNDKAIFYMGDWKYYKGNGLSSFFPAENLFYSSEIFNFPPFWEYKGNEGENKKIKFKVNSLPAGLTQLIHEIYIDSINLNITKIVTDGVFGDIGNQYNETIFSNYMSLQKQEAIKPDYFKTFSIDFGDSLKTEDSEKPDTIFVSEDLIFKTEDIKLVTLDQEPFILPSEGLIFIDLWYVGCYPCLRAAPEVEKAYYKYKDKVHFFSINDMDSDVEKIKRFKEKMKLTIPVLKTQGNKSITRPNQSNSYPYFVLFDAVTGRVFWQQEGFPPDLEQKISEAIDKEIIKKY